MIQSLAHRDAFFSIGREFGPYFANLHVVSQFTAFGQKVNRRGRHAFGHGKNRKQTLSSHRLARRDIGNTGIGIDDEFPVDIGGNLKPPFIGFKNKPVKEGLDRILDVFFHVEVLVSTGKLAQLCGRVESET